MNARARRAPVERTPLARSRRVNLESGVDPAEAQGAVLTFTVPNTDDDAGDDGALLATLRRAWPGFDAFRDHPHYRSGTYRCQIEADDAAAYSANRRALLRFHSDMALTRYPPELSVIRCLRRDAGTPAGGDNLFLHMADILALLREHRRQAIVEVLLRRRRLQLADGTTIEAAMVVEPLGAAPLRVFDRIGWQLAANEAALLEELLELCEAWRDLQVRIALPRGGAAVVSNRHFLHARTACASTLRVTEVCLGTVRTG